MEMDMLCFAIPSELWAYHEEHAKTSLYARTHILLQFLLIITMVKHVNNISFSLPLMSSVVSKQLGPSSDSHLFKGSEVPGSYSHSA